jgi:hypothetical protein
MAPDAPRLIVQNGPTGRSTLGCRVRSENRTGARHGTLDELKRHRRVAVTEQPLSPTQYEWIDHQPVLVHESLVLVP